MGLYIVSSRSCRHLYLVNKKIIVMKKLSFVITATVLFSCADSANKENKLVGSSSFSTEGKKVLVYTTADSSSYRLSATDTLEFTEKGQPYENEVTVFVDPDKTFRLILALVRH